MIVEQTIGKESETPAYGGTYSYLIAELIGADPPTSQPLRAIVNSRVSENGVLISPMANSLEPVRSKNRTDINS